MPVSHKLVIIGGGAAGISVAARLRRAQPKLDIAIIEPSTEHYYQPLWTLVGGGVFPREKSMRQERDYIPKGVHWIKDSAVAIDADVQQVQTADGTLIDYEFLVVAPGLQLNWGDIKGLSEAIGKDGVCSNYSYETVSGTWDAIRTLESGRAVFTHPTGSIKCGGAPLKICYLAEENFRRRKVRSRIEVVLTMALPHVYAVPRYAKTLEAAIERKGIEANYSTNLIEIRPDSKEAVFENLVSGEESVIGYNILHVTPPMGPPDFLKTTKLVDDGGWVDIDKYTLQHLRYENVFGIGDASNLPTSKTAAAVRKQIPVLVANLSAAMKQQEVTKKYDGYTSCPIVTGDGKMVLCEFDYDKTIRETFPFDQSKERRSMYLLKKYGLPLLYWHGMLRGRL